MNRENEYMYEDLFKDAHKLIGDIGDISGLLKPWRF